MKWNEMKWNRMWNANVVYRTEVYRISICFVNDDDEKSLERKKKQQQRLDILRVSISIYTIKYHLYVCSISWLTKNEYICRAEVELFVEVITSATGVTSTRHIYIRNVFILLCCFLNRNNTKKVW
jgi:hypothetical protein